MITVSQGVMGGSGFILKFKTEGGALSLNRSDMVLHVIDIVIRMINANNTGIVKLGVWASLFDSSNSFRIKLLIITFKYPITESINCNSQFFKL
jgi:hypothetical protein